MKIKHYLMIIFFLTAVLLILIATIPGQFVGSISSLGVSNLRYTIMIVISASILKISAGFCYSIYGKIRLLDELAVLNPAELSVCTSNLNFESNNRKSVKRGLEIIDIQQSWKNIQGLGKIGYWRFDAINGNLYCSHEFFNLLDLKTCYKNPNITDFLNSTDPASRVKVIDLFFEGSTGNNCQAINYLVQKQGNSTQHFFQAAVNKKDIKGRLIEVEGMIQNITESKINISTGQDLQANLKAIFESDIVGIIILDCEGLICHYNNRARELFEFNTDWKCQVRKSLISLWEKEEDQLFLNLFFKARGGKVEKYEKKLTGSNGTTIWVNFNIIPLYENEAITGVCITGRDITENKNYQFKIEEQNRILFDIAWMQSHLARAPLARIMSLTQIINSDIKLDKNEQQLISFLHSSCQELDDMIQKISSLTESVGLVTDRFNNKGWAE